MERPRRSTFVHHPLAPVERGQHQLGGRSYVDRILALA
jgi:hypothetical protein